MDGLMMIYITLVLTMSGVTGITMQPVLQRTQGPIRFLCALNALTFLFLAWPA